MTSPCRTTTTAATLFLGQAALPRFFLPRCPLTLAGRYNLFTVGQMAAWAGMPFGSAVTTQGGIIIVNIEVRLSRLFSAPAQRPFVP